MDHVAGPLHTLLAEKEGRIWFNVICLKLYQFTRITWWCLSIIEYVLKSTLQLILKYVMLEKYIKISLMEFASGPPLGGGLAENSRRP